MIEIIAPHGLGDLLGMVHRRNPTRVSVDEYHRRLESKRISERLPNAQIVLEPDPGSELVDVATDCRAEWRRGSSDGLP